MIYVEPNAGLAPVIEFIQSARSQLDLNVYYENDQAVLAAVQVDTRRGVRVYVEVAGNPYGIDPEKVQAEISGLTQAGAIVHTAPAEFEGQDGHYSFDHAKYGVSDRGVLIETANLDSQAFSTNREYLYVSDDPALIKALSTVFVADFTGVQAPDLSQTEPNLVLSPGAENQIVAAIEQPGPVQIEEEEISYEPAIIRALEDKGQGAEIILPPEGAKLRVLEELQAAGVQVHVMHGLYMHAKIIVGGQFAFLGSQNFSATSLRYNREVGILTSDKNEIGILSNSFSQDWESSATP